MSTGASTSGQGPVTPGGAAPAIELRGVNKSFGPVHANRDIDLVIPQGSIHGIIGENGAGKSTLMNILYGFYQADSGTISVDGKELNIRTPEDAIAAGIGMVHQHFMLVEPFTALENLLLGAEGDSPSMQGSRRQGRRSSRSSGITVWRWTWMRRCRICRSGCNKGWRS